MAKRSAAMQASPKTTPTPVPWASRAVVPPVSTTSSPEFYLNPAFATGPFAGLSRRHLRRIRPLAEALQISDIHPAEFAQFNGGF